MYMSKLLESGNSHNKALSRCHSYQILWPCLEADFCRTTVFRYRSIQYDVTQYLSVFRPRGVPGPTSKLSPRVPAQMGPREIEHEGGHERGRQAEEGKPPSFVLPCAQVGCACSRGLQASVWERARDFTRRPVPRAANLLVREPWTFFL
jgi:hypothetical protein